MDKVDAWVQAGMVDPSDLPMVRAVVDVVFDGGDPVTWRDRAGPIPESEPRAMACALAHIADFVDLVDGPGTCEHTLLTALGETLD